MSLVFGIDLGTTYSCVAYVDEYGKPVVLKNSDGDHTTPSVVYVESDSNVIVGTEAKRSVEMEPDKTVQFIKRKMGKEKDTVILNGKEYSAPEVSAYILKKIVADANEELRQTGVIKEGEEVKDVVITCPAYFGMNEKMATKNAGELAGLNVLNIINEPTAAAISYGVSGQEKQETILVYDLGGGTFDITVMRVEGNNIKVICTGGDDQLGGKDFDECLMDYVISRYEEENGEDLSEDPETVAALYVDVENWKKALTSREKVNISVNGPAGRFREELTREKHEELTLDVLTRTRNLLDGVLETAKGQGYPLEKIDKVLLVGGSSRMPQVAKMLEEHYHVTPALSDPDEAVAKGAAIYAANEKAFNDFVLDEAQKTGKSVEQLTEENLVSGEMDQKFAIAKGNLSGGLAKLNISNVLSRTYGLGALDEVGEEAIFNMLMANDQLPATRQEEFYTAEDNQSGIDINIYESLSVEPKLKLEKQTPLTTAHMTFVRNVPKGTGVLVTMALDNSGMLHIMAEEQMYRSKLDTIFQLSNQMSAAQMNKIAVRMKDTKVE